MLAIVVLASASACGGSSDGDGKPADGRFKSVEDLRSAFVDAGGSCDQWDQNDRIDAAEESGDCDDSTVLSTYPDRASAQSAADDLMEATPILDEVLIGDNWIVNTDQNLRSLKEEMGGVIYASKSATETEPESDDDSPLPDTTPRQFIAAMRDLVPALDSADDNIVTQLGKAACDALDSLNFDAVVTTFTETAEESSNGAVKLDEFDAGVIVSGAISTFCPDHTDLLPESE